MKAVSTSGTMVVVEEKQDPPPFRTPEQITSNTVVFFLKHLSEEGHKRGVEANTSH